MIFNLKRPGFSRGAWTFVPSSGETQPEWAAQGADWMMAVPVTGTLTLSVGIPHADLCLIAGGKPGNNDWGGDGGQVLFEGLTDLTLPAGTYTITVGVSGEDTAILFPDGRSFTAASGEGAAGGHSGAGADGVLAWDDAATLLRPGWVCGSGGGRAYVYDGISAPTAAYPGGSIGTASTDTTWGHGGTSEHLDGWPGFPGTGQGGGARGRLPYDSGYNGLGGAGSVLIRNHKEVSS